MINCSNSEIAAVIGCDVRTIERRFAAAIKEGREIGRMSLKRSMWKKAVDEGNVVMQIWLSKQLLGYRDKQEVDVKGDVNLTLPTVDKKEVVQLAQQDPFIEVEFKEVEEDGNRSKHEQEGRPVHDSTPKGTEDSEGTPDDPFSSE